MGKVAINDSGFERRFVSPAEVRVIEDEDGQLHIRGYAAVFGAWSEDLGGFREMVEPGAFTKTIQESDVRSLWNHDCNYVLGRTSSGTLALFVDQRGLGYDVVPPDTQWARDLVTSIRRGDVNGSSFGFDVIKDRWEQDQDGNARRHLMEVRLYDLGPVTFPAYPQTSVEARDKARVLQEAGEPPGAGHSQDKDGGGGSAQARLDLQRRRLDLAEVRDKIGGYDAFATNEG